MHYTALHNYSVSAAQSHVPAQKAPAMTAFTAISASSGELIIPENKGVVIQAKSGINAIRVSGTATTTSGIASNGTTSNQIQFYCNDTIVAAFDEIGLYVNGVNGKIVCAKIENGTSDITLGTPVNSAGGFVNIGLRNNEANTVPNVGFQSTTCSIGWNMAGGPAEIDLINNYGGGFYFYNRTSSTAVSRLLTITSSGISVSADQQNALVLTRSSAGQKYGVGINFRLTGSSTNSYARVYGGWQESASENSRGYIALDVNNNGSFEENDPKNALIYGDLDNGILINRRLSLNSALLSTSYMELRAGNAFYFDNPANNYSWRFNTDSSNYLRIKNQYGTDYMTFSDAEGIFCNQQLTLGTIAFKQAQGLSTRTWFMNQGQGSGNGAGNLHFGVWGYSPEIRSFINPDSASYVINSDVRLKKSITPLNSALSSIMNLNPVNFLYNYQSDDSKPITGFIAQDVQKVIDNVVDLSDKSDENSYLGLNMSGLVPYLVKAMQEQQSLINKLTKRLDILEKA